MKKTFKMLALALALVMITATCTSCSNGESGGKGSGGGATVAEVYSSQKYNRVEANGTDWIYEDDYTLVVYSDNTYMLMYSNSAHHTTDFSGKGEQLTIWYGTCTSGDSADMGEGFLDYTLEKATRVTYTQMLQQGLYFGGEYTIDSTDSEFSAEVADASGYATPADFLAAKASGFTVSVSTENHLIMQVTEN